MQWEIGDSIVMSKEREYRAYAGTCVDLANKATNDEDKKHLLAMAEAWLGLADRVQRSLPDLACKQDSQGLTDPAIKCQKLSASEAPRHGRHHVEIPGDIISECPGDFVGIRTLLDKR